MKALVVAANSRSGRHIRPLQAAGVDVVEVCADNSGLKDRLRWARRIIAQIGRRRDIDAVISTRWGSIGLITALATRVRGVPFIFRPVGDPWQEYDDLQEQGRNSAFKAGLGRWITARLVAWADVVTPVSSSLAGAIADRAPRAREKLRPVPIPVDSSAFEPPASRDALKRALGYEYDCLITLASIFDYANKIKGLTDHLPLLRAAVERFDNAGVVIAGEGPLREEVQRRHHNILDHPRIHMVGWVTEMVQLYQASDIFCHFSYFDACPNVLLEAWACGLPVIVNDYAPLVEPLVAGENGYVLPAEGTVEESLEVFARLVTDEQLRAELGQNGRRLVTSRFSYENLGREMLSSIQARLDTG